jgi:hypothetical protein
VLEVSRALVIVGGTIREPASLHEAKINELRSGMGLRRGELHPLLMVRQGARVRSGFLAGVKGVMARTKRSLHLVPTIDPILHFMRTPASWLSQTERWFPLLSERQINPGSHNSVQQMETAIRKLITVHMQQPKPFHRTKSAARILASITRFAQPLRPLTHLRLMQEINDSGDSSLLPPQGRTKSPDSGLFLESITDRMFSAKMWRAAN